MPHSIPHPPLHRLIVHDEFVRALARSLVTDSTTAEDAVQETYVRAIRTPPREAGKERAFLAVILKNVVSSMRRLRHPGPIPTHLAELHDRAIPDPADILDREAKRREVVEAVLALDPPQRDAILLQYFEGLPPVLAAQRLGIPTNTFLSRVFRAREQLRRRIVDESRDPKRSLSLVGALGRRNPAQAVTQSSSFVAITAAACVVVGVATAIFVAPHDASDSRVSAPTQVAAAANDPTSDPPGSTAVTATIASVLPETTVPREPPLPFRVRGRVFDLEGRRVAHARIRGTTPDGALETLTSELGEFELGTSKPGLVDLTVDSTSHFPIRVPRLPTRANADAEPIDVVLVPGVNVTGRVIDADTGEHVANARLEVGVMAPARRDFQAECDATGSFAVLMPRRGLELAIDADGYERTLIRPFVPTEGQTFLIRLVRRAAAERILVRVLDSSGKPLEVKDARPGPIVRRDDAYEIGVSRERFGTVTRSGPSPRDLQGSDRHTTVLMGVFSSGQEIRRKATLELADGKLFEIQFEAEDGASPTKRVDLTMEDSRVVSGKVLGNEAIGVANATVAYFVSQPENTRLRRKGSLDGRVTTSSDGSFALPPLPEGSTIRLAVTSAAGHALELPAHTVSGDSTKPLEIVLTPPRALSGVVLDEAAPVVGARITATAEVPAYFPPSSAPSAEPAKASVFAAVVHTDTAGRFHFEGLPRNVALRVEAFGFAQQSRAIGPAESEVAIAVVPERVLRGQVVDRTGTPVPGARVSARVTRVVKSKLATTTFAAMDDEPDSSPRGADSHAPFPFATTSGPKGEFELRGLSEGTYTLVAALETASSDAFATPVDATLESDATRHTLRLVETTAILGRLRNSATLAPEIPRAYFVDAVERGGSIRSMGEGRSSFAHLPSPGVAEDVGVESEIGDEIAATGLRLQEGEWREVFYELPTDRECETNGGTLTLELDSRSPTGARITLIDTRAEAAARTADVRFGILGAPRQKATLRGLPATTYRIDVQLENGSPVHCLPEMITLGAGESTTLTLTPR